MDYLNCKDLPIWAQILLHHPVGGERREKDDEGGESDPLEYSETAAAA